MTQKFLTQMVSLGYTETEAQERWNQLAADADAGDPIYKSMQEKNPDTASEEYALNRIEGLPAKEVTVGTVSSDPLHNDKSGNLPG
jgi:hypothetical protein